MSTWLQKATGKKEEEEEQTTGTSGWLAAQQKRAKEKAAADAARAAASVPAKSDAPVVPQPSTNRDRITESHGSRFERQENESALRQNNTSSVFRLPAGVSEVTRTGQRPYEAAQTAADMETRLGQYTSAMNDTERNMGALTPGLEYARSAVDQRQREYSGFEQKLQLLSDTFNDKTLDVKARNDAIKEYNALLPYANQALDRLKNELRTYNSLVGQSQALQAQYNSAMLAYQQLLPEYNAISSRGNLDAGALRREGDRLQAGVREMEKLANDRDELRVNRGMTPDEVGAWQQETFDLRTRIQEDTARAQELYRQADAATRRYENYQYNELLSSVEKSMNDPSWARFSQTDRTMMTGTAYYDRNGQYSSGKKDVDYAIINGDSEALSAWNGNHSIAQSKSYLSQVTDRERAAYNYLYATKGKSAADKFIEQLTPVLNDRQRSANRTMWTELSKQDPWGTSAFSVLAAPAKMVSLFGQAIDLIDDGKIDQNAAYNQYSNIPKDIRNAVSEKIEEKWGKEGSFIYQTGMSMADFLFNSAITGEFVGVGSGLTGAAKLLRPSLAIMGSGAAADTVIELRDRGVDSTRAFALGAIAGLAEIITENVSLEALLNPDAMADGVVRYILKNMAAEGSEELGSDVINWAADALIDLLTGQKESEWEYTIRENMKNGMGVREATEAVLLDRIKQAGLDALGGMISGGVMAGGGAPIQLALNSNVGRAAQAAVQATRQDLAERNAPAPLEAPAQIEGPAPVEAVAEAQPASPLQAAVDKLTAGEPLTQNDAKRIMQNAEAMQTLRDAGVLPETVRNDSAGRQIVRHAVEQYVAQQTSQTAQETQESPRGDTIALATETNMESAPQPGATETNTESGPPVPTSKLRLGGSTLTPPLPQSKLRLGSNNRTEVTNNGTQTPAPAQAEQRTAPAQAAGTVRNAPAEQSFAERARAAAETERSRAILDRSERRTGLGRFLQNYREIRAQQRADQQFASQKQRAAQLQHQADARNLAYTSAAELGVAGGTEKSTMQVIPQDMLDRDQLAAKQAAARDGVDLQFVLGQGEALDDNGAAYNFRGWISADGKRMIVQADHSKLTWQQILSHEELHKLIKSDPEYRKAVESALLADKKLQPYLGGIVDRYVAAYHDMQVFDENEIIEEMLADYRAGFDMLDIYHGAAGNVAAKKAAAKDIRAAEKVLENRVNEQRPVSVADETKASREIDPEEAARAETRALQPVSPGSYTGGPRSRGRSTSPRKKVSRVRTRAFELGGLYNEVEAQMAETQPEKFTYPVESEKESMARALNRLRTDFEGEVRELPASKEWDGEDLDTAMGILYQYRQQGRETGDYRLFHEWSHIIQEKGTRGGKLIQSFAKYSRTATGVAQKAAENLRDQHALTPAQQKRVEGHVNELMRAVDDFAEEAARGSVEDARGAKKGLRLGGEDTQKAKDAMNVVKEIYDIFSRKTRRDHGAPVEEWTKLTGDQLASRIAGRFNSGNKQRTTMQTILDDLLTYASEHALPKREGRTPRTATERITDYLNNREAYGEAWSEAKQVLREMYANDQEKLDALEAFLNSTISYNGEDLDQTMFRAILESADALGLTKDDILRLTAAGVNEGTIDRITEEFLRRIGSDDTNLRDTVARHITNLVMADNQEGRLGRMENEAAKELDLKLQNLLRESKQTKADAANRIAQYLINDLGISGTDAAIAADHIASHYMARIESKAAQTLEKMFAEKGERVKPKQRDKLMDLIHLGGLTNANVEDAVVDALGLGKLTRAQQRQIMDAMAQFADTLDAIENDDLEGLRNLIRLQAAARGTKLSSLTEENLSGETDAEYLRNFATTQLGLIAADYDARSAGEKISTLQVISHLLNARTAMRNVTSNQIFDLVDSTANNVGLLPDLIMSKITGQRTVGFEKSWASRAKRQGAMKGMGRSILEVALDVDPEGRNQSKYGTGGRRTFSMASSGTVGRILSKAEEIMGYELNTTDEFHKGSVYAETLESLGRFVDAGYMTEEEAAEFAAQEALYRSFQDDTKVGAMLAGLKDALNVVGTGKTNGKTIHGLPVHDFGLGDLVVKYTQVPGALIHRAIEYSPVGYLKAFYHIAQLGNAKSRGESAIKQQRNAALALGRATTGSGLIMLFTLLAKLGLLRRGDDEKNKDAATLKNSQGLSGTQINLTAISRLLSGGSAEPQQGDVLHDIGFLEPLDSLMTIAALINNDPEIKNLNLYEMFRSAETAKELVGKSLQGIWLALEDTSAMQTLSNIYSTIRYHDEENDLPLYMQIPMEIASSAISGFVPAPIRQIAQATDTTYRDQYRSQDLLKQTGARVANAIPGLRKQLAPKLTPLGKDKTYQEPWLNALNALVNPGNINIYDTDEVRDELLKVYDETGDSSMLPARNAPYTINIGHESYTLTPDERTEYLRIRGQEETKFVESLLATSWYRNADADTKAAFLNSAKNIANDIAKSQWAAERGITYHDTTYRKYLKMLADGTRYADVIKANNEDLVDVVVLGVPRQVWDDTKEAFNDIANSDISSYDKGVQQRALICDLELDDQQKLVVYGDLANTESREEQFRTVMDTGLSFNETAKIFDKYSEYKSEDETRASQDAKDFALWVDQRKDLTDEQKKVIKEQFKYWQMIPAEAERYEKYLGLGFEPEVASRIDSALSELQPLPGHDSVTNMQRAKAALEALGKNASRADQMKIVESFYGGSTTNKDGDLTQWGKIKKVTGSGVAVDKTLKLVEDGKLDVYVKWMDSEPKKKGVQSNTYISFVEKYNSTTSTRDANGKEVKGETRKDKMMSYINGLNLTSEQKDSLFLEYYAESGLKDTPWHKGGSSGTGKTYSPGKLRLGTPERRAPISSGLTLGRGEDTPRRSSGLTLGK